MIQKKLSLTLFGLLTCGTCMGAGEPVQRFYLDYCYMTPLHQDKTVIGKMFGKISSNGSVANKAVDLYLYNSKHKGGTSVGGSRAKEDGTFYREYRAYDAIYGESNQFAVMFYDSDKNRTKINFDQYFYDNYPYLYVDQLSGLTYEVNNLLGYTPEKGHFMASNKYFFKNWYSINDINIYNKFDVEMFSFEEMFGPLYIPVTYSSIELIIPANYGLFVDQSDGETLDNHLAISLKLEDQGDNHFKLSFNQDLFVNPYTYEMARTQRTGFVPTKYLYLPKNGFHNFNKLDLSIYGEKLGTLSLNFNCHFSIQAQKQRIGDCVTSAYCIHTEDASFNDNGKELVHD